MNTKTKWKCLSLLYKLKSGWISFYQIWGKTSSFQSLTRKRNFNLSITIAVVDDVFSEGTALIDGEGMERLWSYLRRFSYTKEMTLPNRQDLLSSALLHYARRNFSSIGNFLSLVMSVWKMGFSQGGRKQLCWNWMIGVCLNIFKYVFLLKCIGLALYFMSGRSLWVLIPHHLTLSFVCVCDSFVSRDIGCKTEKGKRAAVKSEGDDPRHWKEV